MVALASLSPVLETYRGLDLTISAPRHQEPCSTEPFNTCDFSDGTPWTAFYRTPSGLLLRFPGLADFDVSTDGRQVTCFPVPGVSEATTEDLYLNQVLPLAVSKHGKLVFHGSAVEIAGGAIAFVAPSGRGKSTLAASFAVKGYRFMTDDGLVLEPTDRGYQTLPSHPSLRLWYDSHIRLLPNVPETASAPAFTLKARVRAGAQLTHCDELRPLHTAYFLGDGSASKITFLRLTSVETLLAWAKHSFLLDVEDPSLISAHFDGVATLANRLVCYELDYPRQYDYLERLIEAVVAHATHLSEPQ